MGAVSRRVAVVMGGVSAEREVSRGTGQCIVTHLAERHQVLPVEILADGAWIVPDAPVGADLAADPDLWTRAEPRPVLAALEAISRRGVEVVFNALHGPGGEDGTFQGLLAQAGLPVTGPDTTSAAVTIDKHLTKVALAGAGIETPPGLRFPRPGTPEGVDWRGFVRRLTERVPLPWFVKPARLGSSVGVERCSGEEELLAWAARCGDLDTEQYIVEQHVSGREVTCGVLETSGAARALPPVEIRPRSAAFFDYAAKYTEGATEEICPAPLDPDVTAAVQETALRVHSLFDCQPLSRTDMFLLEDGSISVLEVNTLPGMTATSLIPLSAGEAGISLEELFDSLIEHALRRARISAPAPSPRRDTEGSRSD